MRRAQAMSYRRLCLWTDRHKLAAAVAFYLKLGFVEVPHDGAEEYEIWLEKEIAPAAAG